MPHEFSVQRCTLVCEDVMEYMPSKNTITSPEDIRGICVEMGLHDFADEVVSMFTFNARGRITGYHEIAHGCVTSATVHPREVLKRAILENATSMVLVHNHPSGDCSPSEDDRAVTKRIFEAGKLLGIELIDHLIIAPDGHCNALKRSCSDLFECEPMWL